MALSNAEKVRRYRERQKEKQKQDSLKLDDVFKTPFFEFWEEDANYVSEWDTALALAGVMPPIFGTDDGPEVFSVYHEIAGTEKDADPFDRLENATARGSLPRAEIMVDLILDAARVLTTSLNDYKRHEIKARMAELEGADLSKPEAKKAALKEATRLQKMLDQLDKQVRWTFPQWKVTG